MIDLGKQALANRPLVHFIIAILLIGGGFAFNNMSKLEDPEIKVKQAMVITAYPGASAYEVELEVSDLLEKSIRSMDFIDAVISRSMNDLSMITVELISEAPDDEVEQYWDLLRRKVNDVQSSLPSGAMPSIIKDDFGDMYGMFYAITTEGFGDRELSKYTEMIKREIQSIKGIGDIQVYGEREECINVELIEEKMANLGVHPIEVLATLSDQSQTVYSGYYETGDYRLRVTVNDKYKTVDDIQNLLLQGHEDDQLYLRDIAKVS
ncbi:MAG: efflux RND transporter permease subunit, partial [Bacteroidales bacterium]|nr:efflux RND transporter permease subunit [Bacteroidales bacterium]